jgi:predicted adenine nucleotide alpha hydrolase (AANH) superfamily ATPase
MRILFHICCAPCAILPYERMTAAGHDVTGYFHNPNIHPFIEFRRRLKAVKLLQERIGLPVLYEETYGLSTHLKATPWQADDRAARCAACYRLRLGQTARKASELGCDAFSTTLLSSTHQDHERIREIGEQSSADAGVTFHYEDWRPLAEESHERARRMNLYLQTYCGCIFSEYERFRDTNLHVYKGPGPAYQDDAGDA